VAPDPSSPAPHQLVTPEAVRAREHLAALPEITPAALEAVRREHPGLSSAVVSGLATQARLSQRAGERLGSLASTWVLEDEAVQQATRWEVATYRAQQLAGRTEHRRVADLGCGLGVDSCALAQAGFEVLAIDSDPWRAEAARINLAPLQVRVVCGDALEIAGDQGQGIEVAYVDPARRQPGAPRDLRGTRSRPVVDPDDWSPPWHWIVALAQRLPVVAKVAPGFDARRAPLAADLEWIDHDGDTVEVSAWLGGLGHGRRIATSIRDGHVASIESARGKDGVGGDASAEPTAHVDTWLIEPTPSVGRAGLVDDLALLLGLDRLRDSNWLTGGTAVQSPLVRSWAVLDEVPWQPRELRAWLRDYGPVTWKTADAAISAAAWDRRIGHRPTRGGSPVTIVVLGQRRAFAVARTR
jgi:SAM-dependent methyltransferase